MAKRGRKPTPKKPGPKSKLNEKLLKRIRELIIQGLSLKDIANICGISEATFYTWHWDNYQNLADKIEQWKRDRKLILAEGVIEEMLTMPVNTLEWQGRGEHAEQVIVTNPTLVKVKQDTAKFVAETLGKENYSKRQELTGKDGNALAVKSDAQIKEQTAEKIARLLEGLTPETISKLQK